MISLREPSWKSIRHQLCNGRRCIVLDNASVQTSAVFKAQIARWEEQGLYLLFLPPYSPELNLIEILWRKINYEWLPFSAYRSFKDLSEALDEVLRGIGSKYRLSFAC